MRKLLLLSLMVGALPLFAVAKDGLSVPDVKQQLHFVENKGQVHDQHHNSRNDIQFSIPGKGMSLFVGDAQLHYQFYKLDKPGFVPGKSMADIGKKFKAAEYSMYRMDVELVGANKHAQVIKEEQQQYVEYHYTVEAKRSRSVERGGKPLKSFEAHSYNKITYKDVYPNIDWVLYVKEGQVEYDFVVRPGGNPADIKLKYGGATSLGLSANGGLTATTPMGTVSEAAPYSFQQDGKEVTSSFNLNGDVLTFNVGQYTGTLVIDPTIAWGTYFGDSDGEEYNGMDYDGAGNLYAVGGTNSIAGMATVGSYSEFGSGLNDGFVSKFTTAGVLLWSTYFATAADDNLNAVDFNTATATLNFIGLTTVFGDEDAFFGALDANGGFIDDAAFGVTGTDEQGLGVSSDAAGNIYICGYTTSLMDMGTTGSVQEFSAGGTDGWIWKIDNGGNLVFGTYYGGLGEENVNAVSTDASGNIYASGVTNSTADISTLNTYGGGIWDGYATKINSTGAIWVWGRYLGGTGDDQAFASRANAAGDVFVVGQTTSAGMGTGGFQTTSGGGIDGFVTRLSTAGAVTWSSYYGGAGTDQIYGMTLGATNIYVGGYTESANLPTTNGFQTTYGVGGDGCMANITQAGALTWSSYYGGTGGDAINCVATDNTAAYCAGITSSATGIAFNTLVQPTISAGFDAFISRINECTLPGAPGAISGAISVCAGSSQTYSIAAVTGATSYTWSLPGGWTGTSTTNSITVTAGTTGGTISVTPTNTCGNSTAATLNVTVNPIPTASITPAGPTTFCQGGSVVLNASTGTGYSWAWFQGATPVGTNSSSYTANATGNYTVQITANGCIATSAIVAVTVNPTPDATASSNSAVCVGQTLNLNGSSTTPGATYSWAGPVTFTSNLQNPTIPNAQPTNAGVYTLTVTANGCTQTATTTVVVTNAAPAAPAVINGDISICENSVNTYDVTNDPNAASYTWTLPGGWSGTSTTNSISATANAASGQISVTATNGCGTSAPTTLNVTVNPNPVAVITQAGNTLTVTGTFASYQWHNGAGPIAGATSQSYTATSNGAHYCVVTDANGCTAQSNSITITTDVNNVAKQSSVSLYPNPNNGSFTIEGAFASNDGKANLVIVDIAGRIVHQEQVSVSNNKLTVNIDMNGSLAAGVYTIRVSSDAANAVIPFVKK